MFLPDLRGGGAQRTVVNLFNHLDRRAFNPVLVTGSARGPLLETVTDRRGIVDLEKARVRDAILPLAGQIVTHRPRLLFSAYPDGNIALMLAKSITRHKGTVVLRESNHRSAQGNPWGPVKGCTVAWSYRNADRVVALSNGVREDLITRYRLQPEKVKTIYNPVDLAAIGKAATAGDKTLPEEKGCFQILSAGRLVRQKGFDILIRAVAKLSPLNIRLTVLGEGEDRNDLLNLAERLGIKERVFLPGFQKNPYSWMHRSDLFVLSSRWEGFGHVIVEAMASGTPVLSTRCKSGPDEIITDGVDGILCEPESVEEMAGKIRFMISNPDTRARLSRAGLESMGRFEAGRIAREYEALFQSVLEERVVHGR
ncbi:MAG: glycosyltransferase [Desulfobacteraceae bacterium]|nr:MAG: glycosyltransferase [Desulfobacteraceae bacterium]